MSANKSDYSSNESTSASIGRNLDEKAKPDVPADNDSKPTKHPKKSYKANRNSDLSGFDFYLLVKLILSYTKFRLLSFFLDKFRSRLNPKRFELKT